MKDKCFETLGEKAKIQLYFGQQAKGRDYRCKISRASWERYELSSLSLQFKYLEWTVFGCE